MGLQKLLSIIFFLFMNFSCDSYYESEKNQFKKSSKCGEDKYSSYNKLDLAKESPEKNYKVILGVMEMLSNTCDDDDVAEEFMKLASSEDIEKLSKEGDGRRILYIMKSSLNSGIITRIEKQLIKKIAKKSRR